MTVRPVRLNAAVALLFIVGSACFVLGSIPVYLNAVGSLADGLTYFIGSLFFTSASFFQLVQAQTPAMTQVDTSTENAAAPLRFWAWLPHDRNWLAAITQLPGTLYFNVSTFLALAHNATVEQIDRYVWRPDLFGSICFLVSSTFALLAVAGFREFRPRSEPWRFAGLNMIGSILFLASAVTSYVLPSTGDPINERIIVTGTLLGAGCFLAGAALMFPAWKSAVRRLPAPDHRAKHT